jgi:hypothetical protein
MSLSIMYLITYGTLHSNGWYITISLTSLRSSSSPSAPPPLSRVTPVNRIPSSMIVLSFGKNPGMATYTFKNDVWDGSYPMMERLSETRVTPRTALGGSPPSAEEEDDDEPPPPPPPLLLLVNSLPSLDLSISSRVDRTLPRFSSPPSMAYPLGIAKYPYEVKPCMNTATEFPVSLTPYNRMTGTVPVDAPSTFLDRWGFDVRGRPPIMSMSSHWRFRS